MNLARNTTLSTSGQLEEKRKRSIVIHCLLKAHMVNRRKFVAEMYLDICYLRVAFYYIAESKRCYS